MTVEISAKH